MSRRRSAGGGRGRRPRPRRPTRVETVRIESIAAGGEGVGRLADGRVVFAHRTAPGDLAEIRVVEEKGRWARGRLLRVVEPSPDRRTPPCPFYARCGGCTLEHMEYPAQIRAKQRIVGDALTRIGKVAAAPPAVTPSPSEVRYRNRVSFALRRGGVGGVTAGFHALGAPDELIDVDGRCLLPEPSIARAWDRLRGAWGRDASLLPSGERLRLTLRATAHGQVSLLVEGGFSPGDPESLLDRVDELVAVWHRPGTAPPSLIAGAPGLPETWGDETLELSGAAFLQVNREAAALLEAHVIAVAGDVRGLRVVDAYCGAGLHALRLARAGASVLGLELDPDAIRAANAAAESSGLTGSPAGARADARSNAVSGAGEGSTSFREGPVEALLPDALPADLVILNPPRAGIAPEVVDALAARPPERVVYISCNPATLARDLARMSGAFELAGVRSFDLFPQTAHVETVAQIQRTG